jgi:hypothetical protein
VAKLHRGPGDVHEPNLDRTILRLYQFLYMRRELAWTVSACSLSTRRSDNGAAAMAWTIFGLVTLVALGRFVDFLLGDQGTRRLKDRLVAYYVTIAEGDWSEIFRTASGVYLAYLDRIFGNKVVSARFLLAMLTYSVPLTLVILLSVFGFEGGSFYYAVRFATHSNLMQAFGVVVAVNFVIDLTSIAMLVLVLRTLKLRAGLRTLIIFVLAAGFTYFLVTRAIGLSSAAMLVLVDFIDAPPGPDALPCVHFFQGGGARIDDPTFHKTTDWPCLAYYVLATFWHPGRYFIFWSSTGFKYIFNVAEFSFAVALPMSLYVLVLLTSVMIYYSRSVTQKPLALILTRLEAAKPGLFTILSSALALIVGMLTALQKALT